MKTYHLNFNQDNQVTISEATKRPILPINSRVYATGAGSDFTYAVISIPDEHNRQMVVKISKNFEGAYFGPFDFIESYSKGKSKQQGQTIGFYYDDLEPEFRFTQEQVNQAIEAGNQFRRDMDQKKADKAKHDQQEMADMLKAFPYLQENREKDSKITKKNLIAELKHNFPTIKFSVRKDSYDTYYVSWINGPTSQQVQEITDRYEQHHFNPMEDYHYYKASNFNRVFGGFKYVFTSRDRSNEVRQLFGQFKEICNASERDCETAFGTLFRKTSFPARFSNLTVQERPEVSAGSLEDFYQFVFDTDEPVKLSENTGEISLIDYSDKAIAVVGDTKPIKDQLKQLGGRWNSKLKCGAGWIFPVTKREAVLSLIQI